MDFFNSEENKQKNANGNAESNCNENKIHDTHWTFMLWNIINYFKIKFDKNNIILIEKLEFYYKDNFKLTQISSKKWPKNMAFFGEVSRFLFLYRVC